MPAFARSGSTWQESIPLARNGAAWTAEGDSLFARDGGEWKLIYPDPADAGDLLAVEGLAVTAGPDYKSVTIGWTNPTQPTVTPTEVQIRLAAVDATWVAVDYPITSWSWDALDSATEYLAQVRLVRRVNGIVTDTSPIKSVAFVTDAAPIGQPAPDPGGSGGDTVIPFTGTTGGTPAAPGTANSCWWEWVVQSLADNAYTWTDTALTGTAAGNATSIDIDFASLTAGTIVRVCRREACDTTGNGVADTFGDYECGLPFPAPVNWDAACAGIADSANVTGVTAVDDVVFRYPQLCKVVDTPSDRLVMREAESGTEIARGPGFHAFFTDSYGEQGVLPASTLTSAPFPPVITAGLTALSTTLVPSADWTLVSRFRALGSFSGSNGRVWGLGSWAGIVSLFVTESATGWTPSAIVVSASGVLSLTGTEITFDSAVTHTVAIRWDDDGNLALLIDGVSADTENVSAIDLYDSTTIAAWHAAPAGVAVMQQLGWNRALSDSELADLSSRFDLYASQVVNSGSASTTLTLTIPAGAQDGDILVIVGRAGGSSGSLTGVSGTTMYLDDTFIPGAWHNIVARTIYNSASHGDPGNPLVFTVSSSIRRVLAVWVHDADPVIGGSVRNNSGSSSAYAPPGITVPAGAIAIQVCPQGSSIVSNTRNDFVNFDAASNPEIAQGWTDPHAGGTVSTMETAWTTGQQPHIQCYIAPA